MVHAPPRHSEILAGIYANLQVHADFREAAPAGGQGQLSVRLSGEDKLGEIEVEKVGQMARAKLLMVDDEKAFVESLARRLVLRNFTPVCVFSGREALEQLRKQTDIEVVILDVRMTGMDGIETIREIKRRFPLVEVIMLTGHATIESAVEGMKIGAFDYLLKPCEIDVLVSKIEAAAAQNRYYAKRLMEELIKPYQPKMDEAELLRKIKEEAKPAK